MLSPGLGQPDILPLRQPYCFLTLQAELLTAMGDADTPQRSGEGWCDEKSVTRGREFS